MIALDYGIDFTAPGALRAWDRSIRSGRIESAAAYVGACRRLVARVAARGRTLGLAAALPVVAGEGRIDGRLVALGWCRHTPRAWLGGLLAEFVAYWGRTGGRPEAVGSSYNLDPALAYSAWRIGATPHAAAYVAGRDGRARGHLGLARRRRLLRVARAARRASVRSDGGAPYAEVTRGALAALGRMSPEAQAVVLRVSGYVRGERREVPLRPRDLRWDLAAPLIRGLASPRARAIAAIGVHRGRLRVGDRATALLAQAGWVAQPTAAWASADERATERAASLPAWLAPAYPAVSPVVALRLARGESPVAISGGVLTRAEAHAWLLDGGTDEPADWLVRGLPEVPRLRDVAVARWLLDVHRRGAWAQLTRPQRIHGPAGRVEEVRFADRLDEIMGEDLARGHRTRVEDAFEAAGRRVGGPILEQLRGDHRVLGGAPEWALRAAARYPRAVRVLRTPAALVAEGDALGHCVGGYGTAVERRECVILSLRAGSARSTIEATWEGSVRQHRGPQNAPPPAPLERLAARIGLR